MQNDKSYVDKIYAKYQEWLDLQIREEKLNRNCASASDSELPFPRFAVSRDFKLIVTDINGDSIPDGLFTFYATDCYNGNGYVGDPNYAVLILSNGNDYIIDTATIETIKNVIIYFLKKRTDDERRYITFNNIESNVITGSQISGSYTAYANEDANCCPSIVVDGHFTYLFDRKQIVFSEDNKVIERIKVE